jgi:Domain of unknown function (DUF1877)
MSCRGVFFALDPEQTKQILSFTADPERLYYVQEVIEAAWDEQHLYETDKAWDAIHRCLTDGTLAGQDGPLSRLILGGVQLYSDTDNYIINYVPRAELPAILTALGEISEARMKKQYEDLRGTDYPQDQLSAEDWEYTWEYFSGIPAFVARADRGGRSLVFTVDL